MQIVIGDISNLFLVITTFIAWITYKKYKDTPLKYLPHYLTYASILEFGANFFVLLGWKNTWWYNFGINIEILFYLSIFYFYLNNNKTKRLLLFGGILYELFFLTQVFVIESWYNYQVFPFTFGGILIIVIIFLFLLEIFQSDKILYTHKYLIFWISLGLLFYNIIPLPLFVVRSILPKAQTNFLMGIQFIANIIMYILFTYGFIWSSMKYKSL